MDKIQNEVRKEQRLGWIFFTIFVILIATGIIVKRVFFHPEFMMLFHGPAAVFLILAGRKLTCKLRLRYEDEWKVKAYENPTSR